MELPHKPSLQRSLSFRHALLFGMAFMAPVTVFATYGIAVYETNGMVAAGYLIAMCIMLITAASYVHLVKAFPAAGGSYSFTQKGINPYVGFLVGWTILMDYVFSPLISALLVGIMLSSFFPAVPLWIWILLFICVITTINIMGIKLAANLNMALVLLQILICVAFIALGIQDLLAGKGAGTLVSSLPFFDPQVAFPSLLAILPLLCFSFLGFDAVTTLAEETVKPEKTMPRVVMLIPLIGGVLFVLVTYVAQLVQPNLQSFSNPDSAGMELFIQVGGNLMAACFLAVIVLAGLASAIASGASGARILYAMGREGVLPKRFFGYLSPRYRTPVANLLVIAAIATMAIFLDILTATALINFGALLAFTCVNIAVISHFYIRTKQRAGKGVLLYLLLPLIGALCTGIFWLNLGAPALLLGGAWLAAGFLYLLYVTNMFRQPPPSLHIEASETSI